MPAPAERQLSAHEALVSASGLARLREALVEDFLVLPREGALPGGGAQDWFSPSPSLSPSSLPCLSTSPPAQNKSWESALRRSMPDTGHGFRV